MEGCYIFLKDFRDRNYIDCRMVRYSTIAVQPFASITSDFIKFEMTSALRFDILILELMAAVF